ncbi:MAG: S9 family peptidase [Gemmatimonadetes bacterium]|nr:S9 family peptidase [Gemmatimonadota bacterium]
MRNPAAFAFAFAALAPTTIAGQAAGQLTVDRIVSTARPLVGPAPTSPIWSPDSRALAFLWSETPGQPRDLWVVERSGTGVPTRLTREGTSEFAWLPDGRTLVALHRGRLWLVPLAGSVRALAAADREKADIAVSPDGGTVSYLSEGDLWLQPTAGGSPTRATSVALPASSQVGLGTYHKPDREVGRYVWGGGPAYAWSPDGRFIALQVVDRRQVRVMPFPYYLSDESSMSNLRRGVPGDQNELRMLRVLELATGTLRELPLAEPESVQILDFQWSPRGELLIDRESDTAEDRWLLVADPLAGTVTERWHDQRATRIYNAVSSAWGPNPGEILFVSDLDDWYRLYSLPPGSRSPKPLTPTGSDVNGDRGAPVPQLSPALASVVYVSSAAGPAERQVYRVPARGGTPTRITTRAGSHQPTLSPDGRSAAILHSDDLTPPALSLIDLATGAERIVARSAAPELSGLGLRAPRYLSVPHLTDPYRIHAKLIEPPGFDPGRKYPVIFGPVYSNTVRNRWGGLYGLVQRLLAERGYLVVQVDVRGSTGYGREFREKFLMDWGGGDLSDIESVARHLATLPYADTSRMGIWGSSYGGTLTVYSLFKKPGLFKAGVAGAPATDPRFFGSDDVAIARRPATHPEAFSRGDARQYAGGLRDRLLIIHGMQDDVVPFRTSVVLAEHLIKLGKDFDLVFAPGATHGWTQREHDARFLLGKLVAHFERYLRSEHR